MRITIKFLQQKQARREHSCIHSNVMSSVFFPSCRWAACPLLTSSGSWTDRPSALILPIRCWWEKTACTRWSSNLWPAATQASTPASPATEPARTLSTWNSSLQVNRTISTNRDFFFFNGVAFEGLMGKQTVLGLITSKLETTWKLTLTVNGFHKHPAGDVAVLVH